MSKYLFMLSHPAHFHMFRYTIDALEKKGHELTVVIRPKDVLEQLCIDAGLRFIKTNDRPEKFGIFGLGFSLLHRTRELLKITRNNRPDLLIGSDGVLAYLGFFRNIPSFEWYEDDARAIRLYALMFFPFYRHLVSPEVVDAWLWKSKKIGYNGYQKLAYLHPAYFQPDLEIKKRYIPDESYFLLRFSALTAHHDVGIKGFDTAFIKRIIRLLEPFGKVYISSEKPLIPEFEEYALKIKPLDMHHVLAFSSLLIGDTQSMCVEAAVLGVPSVRYSGFAGKLSVLEELEHRYRLSFGFKPGNESQVYQKIEALVHTQELRTIFANRRQRMLDDKIDVSAFYVWLIENYPASLPKYKPAPVAE